MTELGFISYQIKIGPAWCTVTDPDLFEQCNGDEKKYFRTLRDRQKKVLKPDFFIPDSEPGIIPGEMGF